MTTPSLISSLASTANASPYTATGANAPTGAANSLLTAFVLLTPAADPTSVTGHGVTWTRLQVIDRSTSVRSTLWVADGNGATNAAQFSVAVGGSPTGCAISVIEWSDIDTSGGVTTVGAGKAVIQAPTGSAASGTTGTQTFAALAKAANRCVGSCHAGANAAQAADQTQLHETHFNTPATAQTTEWSNVDGVTSLTWTLSASLAWRTIGAELNTLAAAASGPLDPMGMMGIFGT